MTYLGIPPGMVFSDVIGWHYEKEDKDHWFPDFGQVLLGKAANPYAAVEYEYTIRMDVEKYVRDNFPEGTKVEVKPISFKDNSADVRLEIILPEDSIYNMFANKVRDEMDRIMLSQMIAYDEPTVVANVDTIIGVDMGVGESKSVATVVSPGGVTCKRCNEFNEFCTTPSQSDGTHLCYKCRCGY